MPVECILEEKIYRRLFEQIIKSKRVQLLGGWVSYYSLSLHFFHSRKAKGEMNYNVSLSF